MQTEGTSHFMSIGESNHLLSVATKDNHFIPVR